MSLLRKFLPKRRKRPSSTPPWMYWLGILFVLYALASGMRLGTPENPNPIRESAEKTAAALEPSKLLPIEQYKNILFPSYIASLDISDFETGKGAPAICGQQVRIAYRATIVDGKTLAPHATIAAPLTFHIGDGSVIPALEQGVTGMRPGGKRSLIATLNMSYGIEKFALKDEKIAPDARIRFDVEMVGAATPATPNIEASPYRIADTARNDRGAPFFCGEPATINVTLWALDGKKLFSTRDKNQKPITFTPGKSEVFLGLEQGIIGMTRGSQRTLIVPPDFQNTMRGGAATIHFPLPKTQTVLVDVEALP